MKDYNNNTNPYKDIINLPRHIAIYRKHMSIRDRSAQFSPFAAVAGHDNAIKETSRLTNKKIELDENAKTLLDEKLDIIRDQLNTHQEIEITFFQPDHLKSGGSYLTKVDTVKKIDIYENTVIMNDGFRIPILDIIDIEGQIFQVLDDFFA